MVNDAANFTVATRTARRRWLLAALLFVLFRALPNISYPIGRDQATYFVIGEGLLNGQRLYRYFPESKPPGILVFYALLGKVFGHVMWSVGLVDILWLLVISYCIFRFAERYLGTPAAAIAVAVNADWHCHFGYTYACQTECLLMLLVFAGYFAVAGEGRRPLARHFAAGLCLGGAFWLKYNALAFLPLLALLPDVDWSRFDERPRHLGLRVSWRALFSRVAALLAGFSILVAVVLGYFYLVGSWPSFKEIQLEVLPRYAVMAERTSHYWEMAVAAVVMYVGLWTWVGTALSFLMAERRDLSRLTPVLVTAALGFACTASQVRFNALYFETCYPFFAMIWGYLVVKTYGEVRAAVRSSAVRERVLAWTAACALAGVALVWPLRAEVRAVTERYRDFAAWRRNPDAFFASYPAVRLLVENLGSQMEVIRALRQLCAPGDGVFVWGTNPLIYFLTGRRPPTGFVSNFGVVSAWSPPAWREELVRDLEKSPPEFIVVAQHDNLGITDAPFDSEQYLSIYPRLANFISGSYDFMEKFQDFVLYRRKPRAFP
jgi:hypothetical protein